MIEPTKHDATKSIDEFDGNMEWNELNEIPTEIGYLTGLAQLQFIIQHTLLSHNDNNSYASENKLKTLPTEIGQLAELTLLCGMMPRDSHRQ